MTKQKNYLTKSTEKIYTFYVLKIIQEKKLRIKYLSQKIQKKKMMWKKKVAALQFSKVI